MFLQCHPKPGSGLGADQLHPLWSTDLLNLLPPLAPCGLQGKASVFWSSIWGPSEPDPGLPFVSHLLLCPTELRAPLSLNRLAPPSPASLPLRGCHLHLEYSPLFLPPPNMLYSPSPKLQITSALKQKESFPLLGTHRTLLQAWDATGRGTLLIALWYLPILLSRPRAESVLHLQGPAESQALKNLWKAVQNDPVADGTKPSISAFPREDTSSGGRGLPGMFPAAVPERMDTRGLAHRRCTSTICWMDEGNLYYFKENQRLG